MITLIMPCLNMVDYIGLCLESVINQSYTDLEILIIDAGSIDGTLDVIEKYRTEDSRIRLIRSDKKSYGYQVNLGLQIASGDYIGVVDTDDIVPINAYEILYKTMKENSLDYVKGYAKSFWKLKNGKQWEQDIANFFIYEGLQGKIICPRQMPDLIVKDHFLWLGLYTKKLLDGIRLNETAGAAFQDQGFCLQLFRIAERAMYIDEAVYLYRQDNASSSTYNSNGLKYIREEYSLNLHFLEGKNRDWYASFYCRLWDQCYARFEHMAVTGYFWEDANGDIVFLQKMLADAVTCGFICPLNLSKEKWQCLETFLRSPKELYDYFSKRYLSSVEELHAFLDRIGNSSAIIVGCGNWGRFLHVLLDRHDISVKTYCDNNRELWGESGDGLLVVPPEEAVKKFPGDMYIVASKHFFINLKNQLLELGIQENKVIQYCLGTNMQMLHIP